MARFQGLLLLVLVSAAASSEDEFTEAEARRVIGVQSGRRREPPRRRRSRRRLTVDELATAGLEPAPGVSCAEQSSPGEAIICTCHGSSSQTGRVTYGKRTQTFVELMEMYKGNDNNKRRYYQYSINKKILCSDNNRHGRGKFRDPADGETKHCFCQPCECSRQQSPKTGHGGYCGQFGDPNSKKWCYVRQDHCEDERGEAFRGIGESEDGYKYDGLWRSAEACDSHNGPSGGGSDRKDVKYKDEKNEEGCHAPHIGSRLECETCFHTEHCLGFEDDIKCDPKIKKCVDPSKGEPYYGCKGPIAHCDPPCDKCSTYNCTDECNDWCDTKGDATRPYKERMDWITWANLFESKASSKLISRDCVEKGQVGEAIRGLTRIYPLIFFGVLIVVFAP